MREFHSLDPIYDANSKVLILGSFPSVKSRELKFYYANPQNQFWKIMQELFATKIEDKKEFLLNNHIALWDVVKSCEIENSKDTSIKEVDVNDLDIILNKAKIKQIFTVGKKATELYQKYLLEKTGIKSIYLPSTSPLYSVMPINEKIEKYRIIQEYLN